MLNNNLLHVAEFAKKLKVTPAAVLYWIKNKLLPENSILNIGSIRIRRNIFENHYNVNLDYILTYEEAAKILRTSKGNIKVLFSRKQLPEDLRIKIIGTTRIKGDLLEKFIMG